MKKCKLITKLLATTVLVLIAATSFAFSRNPKVLHIQESFNKVAPLFWAKASKSQTGPVSVMYYMTNEVSDTETHFLTLDLNFGSISSAAARKEIRSNDRTMEVFIERVFKNSETGKYDYSLEHKKVNLDDFSDELLDPVEGVWDEIITSMPLDKAASSGLLRFAGDDNVKICGCGCGHPVLPGKTHCGCGWKPKDTEA